MGNKYMINYGKYKEQYGYSYQNQWFILALIKFIFLRLKYDWVTWDYRRK